MAFLNRSYQGASSPGYSFSHENSPFGSDDSSAVTPRTFLRPSPSSDRSYSVSTQTKTDSPSQWAPEPSEVIDLTNDNDDPPAAQYPATRPIQANGGGYNWGTMNGSGVGNRVATSAGSDTERVAAGRSARSIGKMKVPDEDISVPIRATPVDQHMELPSLQESRARVNTDAHTPHKLDKLYGMVSQLQQNQKTHDKEINKLSERMAIVENSDQSVRDEIHQLSTKIDNGMSQLAEDALKREKRQRREDQKQRQWADRDYHFRQGMAVGIQMLSQGLGPARQNAEQTGFSSFAPYQPHASFAGMPQHTHSSWNSTVPQGPPRRAGYENPRNPKVSRGRRFKTRFDKTRRHRTPSTRTCTPNPTPASSVWNTIASSSSVVGATETVHSIKSERSLYSIPATPTQHPSYPKRERSSGAPGRSTGNCLESQSSQTE